jgi:hypothetical protein
MTQRIRLLAIWGVLLLTVIAPSAGCALSLPSTTSTNAADINLQGKVSFTGFEIPQSIQATVICSNKQHRYQTSTTADGAYQFSGMVPGVYTCSATSMRRSRTFVIQIVSKIESKLGFLLCSSGCPSSPTICDPGYPNHYAPCGALPTAYHKSTSLQAPQTPVAPGDVSLHTRSRSVSTLHSIPGGTVINLELINYYFIFWRPNGTCMVDCSTATNGLEAQYTIALPQMTDALLNTHNPWRRTLLQYGISSYAGDGQNVTWTDTRPYVSSAPGTAAPGTEDRPLQQVDIVDEIRHAILVNGWPTTSPVADPYIQNVFVVLTARGVESCTPFVPHCSFPPHLFSQDWYCAYHDFTTTNDADQFPLVYIYLPDSYNRPCNLSPQTYTSDPGIETLEDNYSHELAETLTDPYINAWFQDSTRQEIGDLCEGVYGPLNPYGSDLQISLLNYTLQTEWSNAYHACSLNG